MPLRAYQSQAAADTGQALSRYKRVLVSMATGTGKTWVAAQIMTMAARRGWRILYVAHREELLDQAARALGALDPTLPLGLVRAERDERNAPVVLAMVQSLTSARVEALPRFDCVITDEGHHAPAPSYQRVYQHARGLNRELREILFTATPYRTRAGGKVDDLLALGVADTLAFEYGLQEAMDDGWLVPEIAALRIPTGFTLGSAREGEFVLTDVDNAARNRVIVGSYRTLFPRLPLTIGFAATVAHAQHMAQLFRDVGISSAAVWGSMDQDLRSPGARRSAFEDFRVGRTRVLWNRDLATEGVDLPATEALLMARPTASLGLWVQMLGRGTRPGPHKPLLGVLDYTDNVSARLDLRPAGLADVAPVEQGREGPYELFRLRARPRRPV